ncbi:hypothetical protein G6F40_016225 [Rhizopus arrhizus]|nr:hypothetical protein G6F40_016225 [Rhizopus arrhizus]
MRDRWRNLQPFETELGGLAAGSVLALDCVHADVGAGQQCAQARHPADIEPRPAHPESGAFARQVRHFLGQIALHDHLAAVAVEADGLHRADVHVLVAQLGLAHFQPFGRIE